MQFCIARHATDTHFFGDGKHKYYLEKRCGEPRHPDADVCMRCMIRSSQVQRSRSFPHGKVNEWIPSQSHIYGGAWFAEGVKRWGAPSMEDLYHAEAYQREAREGFDVPCQWRLEDLNPRGDKEADMPKKAADPAAPKAPRAPRKKKVEPAPIQPMEPFEPLVAAEATILPSPPASPAEPAESAEPAEPAEPAVLESAKALEPAKALESAKALEPLQILDSQEPAKPAKKAKAPPRPRKKKEVPVSPVATPTSALPTTHRDILLPTHLEVAERFDADGFEVEIVTLTRFEHEGVPYFRSARNKLYRALRSDKIGDYVGRYDPMTDRICRDVEDSDQEE